MLEETDPKFPLPPCRICGASGAGFHYGVNTCEACKGFFHRSLNHWARYKCVNKGNCTIQFGKGKMCRLCRYQKCLDQGMSKSAIKTGRYNYKKKTDDILEVKQMVKELSRESKKNLATHVNFFQTSTIIPSCDSGSQDSLRDILFDGPVLSNSKSCSPVPSCGQDKSCLYGQQNTSDFRLNQNQAQSSSYNTTSSSSVPFSQYSMSPDSSSQWMCDNMSISPPNTAADGCSPGSPTLSMSSSFSPYCANVSPSSSYTDRSRFHSCESIPVLSQSPSLCDSILPDTSQQQQYQATPASSRHNTTESTSPTYIQLQSKPLQNQDIRKQITHSHSHPDLSLHENSPTKNKPSSLSSSHSSSTSSKPITIIDTFEMLSIQPGDNSNSEGHVCNKDSSGTWTKCSCGRDNEVSSTCDISNVQALFGNKDEVVKNLVEAHQSYVTQHFKDIPKDELLRQQRDHYESCVLRKEIFGQIRWIPDHEYEQLYGATGIDADNRAKRMSDYAKGMENTIQLMVCFAMTIPGFADLPKRTKLHLIKFSRQEFSLMNLIKYVNLELKVYRGVEMGWQCSLEMENSKYRDILDSVFMFLGKFQALNLTLEESVVMNALVIMAPDRESEVSWKVVHTIYNELVDLLIYLLSKRFDRPMLVFAKLMGLITECRTKVEEMATGFKDYKLIRYMPIKDKPLIQLMFSGIYF